jgi:hypothetical protein
MARVDEAQHDEEQFGIDRELPLNVSSFGTLTTYTRSQHMAHRWLFQRLFDASLDSGMVLVWFN